jgi:Dolichyl-phosphate-mannose-protein mannosyltransferase
MALHIKNSNTLHFVQRHTGLVLFFTMFIIALFSYQEYGIGWDETIQHKTGIINLDYITSTNDSLLDYYDRDYGIAFELPLVILEKTFRLKDTRDIFLMRHLVTHLFFLLGAFFCFQLVDFLYKNKWLASIAFLLLVLHPRIYGHSFFNPKDVPFLSMFIISLYFTALAFHRKTLRSFIMLGISVGLLINMRIMGIMLLTLIGAFLLIDMILEKKYRFHLKLGVAIILTSCITLFVSWPYLWNSPFGNFHQAWSNMSHFRWAGSVLFQGRMIKATQLDWYYIPVWFLITTPIIYIISGGLGIGALIISIMRKPIQFLRNNKSRNNLLYLLCFMLPIFAVIYLKSVLYDGWRQMFFIYPSFVLLIVYGLNLILKRIKHIRPVIPVMITLVMIVPVAVTMYNFYPFEHVYFNPLVNSNPPEKLRKTYDLDYWGLSYKQSLSYILANDSAKSIHIAVANEPGKLNLSMLHIADRQRINISKMGKAKYFVTNYRWHPDDYDGINGTSFYAIKRNNSTISEVFKLNTK